MRSNFSLAALAGLAAANSDLQPLTNLAGLASAKPNQQPLTELAGLSEANSNPQPLNKMLNNPQFLEFMSKQNKHYTTPMELNMRAQIYNDNNDKIA